MENWEFGSQPAKCPAVFPKKSHKKTFGNFIK